MQWFAAHAIFYFRFKDGVQDSYHVWENIYLVEAGTFDEAQEKARAIALTHGGDDNGTLHFSGRPAELVFKGVRKVVTCVDESERPTDRTELTYSDFEVGDLKALEALANDRTVMVEYKSSDIDEDESPDEAPEREN
jgi:hypothetical protein